VFGLEDGGSIFLRNVGQLQPDCRRYIPKHSTVEQKGESVDEMVVMNGLYIVQPGNLKGTALL
jgi:hypothetical protein